MSGSTSMIQCHLASIIKQIDFVREIEVELRADDEGGGLENPVVSENPAVSKCQPGASLWWRFTQPENMRSSHCNG